MAETIATTTMTPKASENIKLNPLKPFTGKRSNFILLMQDVYVYLKVNRLIYNDDEKKISFILSYLADGDTAVWKQQFIQTKIEKSEEAKTDKPNWGTYKEFVEALKKTFQPYDKLAEALEDMKKLHLGDGSITEHNSRFRLLVSQTGMKDSPALTDLYRSSNPNTPQRLLKSGIQRPLTFTLDTKGRNAFSRNKITNQRTPTAHFLCKRNFSSLKRRTLTPWTLTVCQSKNKHAS
jgi:Retrotransposon gag protein